MTDGELLQQYAATNDGEAFAELVRRHGGMVHAAARRLARDDAEDVTQAVFLLLAQRAGKLARYRNVAGWLYSVTRYCASNARRTHARRGRHLAEYQREAAMTKPTAASSPDDPGASEMLDVALAKLKEDQRQAVLLRYIEGLSLEESAQRLGINAAAVAKRAERGILRLREYFAARGVTLNDAALAATPVSGALFAKLAGGGGSTAATAIASGAKASMTLAAVAKVAAAVVIAAAGVAVTAKGLSATRPSGVRAATTTAATIAATKPTLSGPSMPAGLTAESGVAAGEAFLRAIRERDEAAIAALSAESTDAARRDFAVGVIAEVLDRAYVRFPQRLDRIVNTSMTMQSNRPILLVLDAQTPTLSQVRRLRIELVPVGDVWRVTTARMSQVNVAQGKQLRDGAATRTADPRVPPGTYARAAGILQSLQSSMMFDADSLTEADVPRVVVSLERAERDVPRLAEVLRTTDLAIDDASVELVVKYLRTARERIGKRGITALKHSEDAATADPAMRAAGDRFFGLGEELGARADAESEAQKTGPRPPAFGPDVAVTLGWNGHKVTLPGPVMMPPWFRESRAFKQWQKQHNIATFRTRDDAGSAYEIFCSNGVRESDGKVYDVIPAIRQYRPDGTLAASSDWDHYGQATGWSTYDATGERFVTRVMTRSTGEDGRGPREVMQVEQFDAEENQRDWNMRAGNVVWLETLSDPIGGGSRVLNQAPVARKRATRTATATTATTKAR